MFEMEHAVMKRERERNRSGFGDTLREKTSTHYVMKSFLNSSFLALCLFASVVSLSAQTPSQPTVSSLPSVAETPDPTPLPAAGFINLDFLTNIPTAGSYLDSRFAVGAGVLLRNGSVENELKADCYFRTNWVLSAAIQNAPSATVVDSFTVFAGYRKAWAGAEVYGQALVRRTWALNAGDRPGYQAGALLGASWTPMSGGHFSLGTEARLLTSPNGPALGTRPAAELVVFTKILF
jgi:hypothetical protein